MHARLVPIANAPPVELTKDLTLVGRTEDCDVRFEHKSVSKLHCVLVKTDGLVLLRDLGSTNGTRVNGQRVRRAALLPGDNLAVANVKFVVKFGVALEPDAAPPGEPAKPATGTALRNALPDVYPDTDTPGE